MAKRVRRALLVATLLCNTNALASGWYIGGGLEFASFQGDLEDIDAGFGPVFSAGYRFPKYLAFDLLWGVSVHDESRTETTAGHGNLLGGLKLFFNDKGNVQPYLTAGLSSHVIDFEVFEDITGTGYYWGLGLDVFVARKHAINVSFRDSTWTGDDGVFDYDAGTSIFSVVYNYHFSR